MSKRSTQRSAGNGQPVEAGQTVSIEIPALPEVPRSYIAPSVEVNHLTETQRNSLRRLALGLEFSGAKLENGKHATHGTDAIRWLLEQIGRTDNPTARQTDLP